MKYYCAFPKRPDNPENSNSDGYFIAVREANTDKEFTDTFIDSLLGEFDLKDRPDIKNMCNVSCNCKEIKLLEFKGHFFYILYTSQIFENEIFSLILNFCGTLKTGKILDSDTINKILLGVEIEQVYKQLFPEDGNNRLLKWFISINLGELKEKTILLKDYKVTDEKRYGEKRNTTKGRIEIYNLMKKNGCNDSEIFRYIMLKENPSDDRLQYKKGKGQTRQYHEEMGKLRVWKSKHKKELVNS